MADAIPESLLTELKSKNEEIWTVEAGSYVFVIKAPGQGQYDRCIGTMAEHKTQAPQALRQLAMDCIVHPDRKEAAAIFQKRPALASIVASECLKIAGEEETEKAKKV